MFKNEAINVREIKELVDEFVEEKLYHILIDPDEGLELSGRVKKRLKKSLKSQAEGRPGIPLDNIISNYKIGKE